MYCGQLNHTCEDMSPTLHISTPEYGNSHFGIYGLAFDSQDEYHAVFYESVHFMGSDDLIKDVFENGTGFELSLKYCGYLSSYCFESSLMYKFSSRCEFFYNSVTSSFSTEFFNGLELKDALMEAGPTSIHAEEKCSGDDNSASGDIDLEELPDGITSLTDGYSIVFHNIFFYRVWLHKISTVTKQIPIHMVPCELHHHDKKCLMSDSHHTDTANKFRSIIDEFIAWQDANLSDYTLVVRQAYDLDFSERE